MYSQKWKCAASVPISTFMCVWGIYIFPGLVNIFSGSRRGRPRGGNIEIAHRHMNTLSVRVRVGETRIRDILCFDELTVYSIRKFLPLKLEVSLEQTFFRFNPPLHSSQIPPPPPPDLSCVRVEKYSGSAIHVLTRGQDPHKLGKNTYWNMILYIFKP